MNSHRDLILRIVRESGEHLTARGVYEIACREEPGIAYATVYNNLNALCEAGVITRVRVGNGADRFDKAPGVLLHGHAVCPVCGRMTDIGNRELIGMIVGEFNTPVESVDLIVHTVCSSCFTGEKPVKE